jgi:hypothetical protein
VLLVDHLVGISGQRRPQRWGLEEAEVVGVVLVGCLVVVPAFQMCVRQ